MQSIIELDLFFMQQGKVYQTLTNLLDNPYSGGSCLTNLIKMKSSPLVKIPKVVLSRSGLPSIYAKA